MDDSVVLVILTVVTVTFPALGTTVVALVVIVFVAT
jgi:hypothetical protein